MPTDIQFSTENLLKLLDQVKKAIGEEILTQEAQERVWDTLQWDTNDPDNEELVKYLFTGWWVHQHVIRDAN